jgi:hypothetical protein
VFLKYTLKVQICYETFVLICRHSGTFLIRILCPKIVKIPQNCLLIIVFFTIGPNMLCVIIYICSQSCTTTVSRLLPFMVDITHSHNIVLSISQWLLHYINVYYICPEPVFQCEFNCNAHLIFEVTCFGNF